MPNPDENFAHKSAVEGPQVKRKFAIKIVTRGAVIRLSVLAAAFAIFGLWAYVTMIKMGGESYAGPLPALGSADLLLKNELVRSVRKLAGEIGERNIWNRQNLSAAADFVEEALAESGYEIRRQCFEVKNTNCCNIEVENQGTLYPDQIVVVGAHYDSVFGSPGANDNASAVAAVLALARRFAPKKTARTLRFVLFANEEPPFFRTGQMGSLVYAKSCRTKGENITAMICLETIGYYTDQPDSQKYPFPLGLFYPSTGNFIAFVSNLRCRRLLRAAIASFRRNCKFPSEAAAIPAIIPGISWSDHWAFWRCGYPAIMVTDTAPFRYPCYHLAQDTCDKIDYDRLTIVVSGLEAVISEIAALPARN